MSKRYVLKKIGIKKILGVNYNFDFARRSMGTMLAVEKGHI